MLVGEEEAASSRMGGDTTSGEEEEEEGLVTWSWSPDQAGGSINMYMYNNSMSMINTNFSMEGGEMEMGGEGEASLADLVCNKVDMRPQVR